MYKAERKKTYSTILGLVCLDSHKKARVAGSGGKKVKYIAVINAV